jgi:hypothetical protein
MVVSYQNDVNLVGVYFIEKWKCGHPRISGMYPAVEENSLSHELEKARRTPHFLTSTNWSDFHDILAGRHPAKIVLVGASDSKGKFEASGHAKAAQ